MTELTEQEWFSYARRYEMVVTCEAVPVQIEGTIDGHPFYYRARHGHWRLHACDVNALNDTGGDLAKAKARLAEFMGAVVAEGDLDGGEYDDGTIPEAFARIAEHGHRVAPDPRS